MNVNRKPKIVLSGILAATAMFSWYQLNYPENEITRPPSIEKPQFFIENVRRKNFGLNGGLEYVVDGDTANGTADGSTINITRPHLKHYGEEGNVAIVYADAGTLNEKEELTLLGNVYLSIAPISGNSSASATTSAALVNLETGVITSEDEVTFIRHNSNGRGMGFTYDHKQKTLVINSRVSITFNVK